MTPSRKAICTVIFDSISCNLRTVSKGTFSSVYLTSMNVYLFTKLIGILSFHKIVVVFNCFVTLKCRHTSQQNRNFNQLMKNKLQRLPFIFFRFECVPMRPVSAKPHNYRISRFFLSMCVRVTCLVLFFSRFSYRLNEF
jgi:hypothetical protein